MDSSKDSVLYLIDASIGMEKDGILASALFSTCEAIRITAKEGISQYDAGVIVYNVDTESGAKTLLELGQPSIDELKKLIRIVNMEENDAFKSREASGNSFVSAIREAKVAMNRLHTKSYRRIVIITNDDDPFRGDFNSINMTVNLISDLVSLPSVVVPVFINPSEEKQFDTTKFWEQIKYLPVSEEVDYEEMKPIDYENLNSRKNELVLSRSRQKFTTFKGELKLNALSIGVNGYAIVRPHSSQPSPLNVGTAVNDKGQPVYEMLTSITTYAKSSSGTEIDKNTQFSKKIKLSSSMNDSEWSIDINQTELDEIRELNSDALPTISIKRFVPLEKATRILFGHGFVGHSLFIVPSDRKFRNSNSAFSSLHRSMSRKKVVALALYAPNHQSLQLGLIYAFNPNHTQVPAPNTDNGLYFVPLPFIDDLRTLPESPQRYEIPTEKNLNLLDSCSNTLIMKFRLGSEFDSKKFPNPQYSQFTYILEHLALSLPMSHSEASGVPVLNEPKDTTCPRYAKISQFSSKIKPSLNWVLSQFSSAEPLKRVNNSNESPLKRIKTEEVSIETIKEAFKNESLDKWTVANLKAGARELADPNDKIPIRKSELLEYIKHRV